MVAGRTAERRARKAPSGRTLPHFRRSAAPPLRPILVLVNPQDIVNIASAVRIAKNFGIERMRLVNPEVFDPYRIEGIAHNTRGLRGPDRDPGLARGRARGLRFTSRC